MEAPRQCHEVIYSDAPPVLPGLGILAGLEEFSRAKLALFGRYHKLPAGVELMSEGDVQDRFYVVVSGQLSVNSRSGGKETMLGTVYPGECLGEVSLLEPGPASATVRVVRDAMLWSMDINELRAYLFEHTGGAGTLLMGMAECLSHRLRQANQLIAKHHMLPVETLPEGRERAITASNTPVQIGFFERIKKSLKTTKSVRISTKIKM
jgi:CRP-like cAMP-binding protein